VGGRARGASRGGPLYRKAIDRARDEPSASRAELLENEAAQRYLSGDRDAALRGHREAAELYNTAGDRACRTRAGWVRDS